MTLTVSDRAESVDLLGVKACCFGIGCFSTEVLILQLISLSTTLRSVELRLIGLKEGEYISSNQFLTVFGLCCSPIVS